MWPHRLQVVSGRHRGGQRRELLPQKLHHEAVWGGYDPVPDQ